MKYIEKQSPPERFIRYKKGCGATFEDLSENHIDIKQELRASLVEEQGYICCYCGCRIDATDAIVEHLKPKDGNKYPQLQLEYTNLLASCDGGQDARHNGRVYPSCCDNCKGNSEISIHPLMPECESRFLFDAEGAIICAQDDLEAIETIDVLNLKSPVLKNRRKAAIEGFKYYPKDWDWEQELKNLGEKNAGCYVEFCFVIKSYILNFKLV